MKKMKAKGYSRGGAPTTRAQRRSTLSKAQKNLLDSVQGREGSKQSTSVIQNLSDQYGYKPGKRAGAKGGMGKGKRAKPPGMQRGGVAVKTTGMGGKEAGSSRARSGAGTGRSISQLSDAQKNLLRSVQSTGRKQPTGVIDDLTKKYGNLAARKQRQTLKAKAPKPPGMQRGGAMKAKGMQRGGMMKAKGMQRGGMMKAKGMKKGGKVAGTSRPSATSGFRAPSSKSSGLYGK